VLNCIYLVGGSKGGVGKSLVSMAVVNFFLEKKKKVLLFDTDDSNPDVAKIYSNITRTELVNLDTADGWIDMVNTINEHHDHIVIINTAARNNTGIAEYSETLTSIISELKRKLITFWVINRQRDSLELLKKYASTVTNSQIHVICNGYFGEMKKFELYNSSNIKNHIEEHGGKTVLFPDLADRVTDEIYNSRISIMQALKDMPMGNRAELLRWKNSVTKMLEVLINE
jgi:CO dehydrogenase nickel-insertion accessory protein CooC1